MLILSRRRHEQIIVNDNIVITVVGVRGDRVRIGVEAPASVAVFRSEVYERIQSEKRSQPRRDDERPAA